MESEKIQKKYVSKKERLIFALSAVGSYMIVGFTNGYLMIFFTDLLIVTPTFVFGLMVASRIWDAVNDPLMGILIDKTHTRYGKMRPYVFLGSIAIFVFTILLFLPIPNAHPVFKMVYAAVMYLCFGMAYTLVDVPAMGLMSVATPNNDEMASLLSLYVTVGSVGSVIPMALLPVFTNFFPEERKILGYFAFAIFAATLTCTMYLVLFKNSTERCATRTESIKVRDMIKVVSKNKPMVLTLLSSMIAGTRYLIIPSAMYVATYVLKLGNIDPETITTILSAIVGAGMFAGILLSPVLYKKIGYKKVFLISAFVGAVFLGAAYFVGHSNFFLLVPFLCIGGLALGAYNVLPYPMVGDSLDYLQWKTGQRMEGVCFSLNSFVTKFNNAIGSIGLAIGLILIGFVQPVVSGVPLPQKESTLKGIFAMVTLVPAIGFLFSAIPMFFYDYEGAKKEKILSEIGCRKCIGEAPSAETAAAEQSSEDK
jgi:sugar (glycoside-pentoside-hexuronide) transporter